MIALDTNILIYACDRSDPARQHKATQLIERSTDGVLLWQVACEFVAASRKLATQGFTAAHAWSRLAEFQAIFPLILPSDGALQRGRELHVSRNVAFWDAMILGACLEAGVQTLYSEDTPGLSLATVKVINPFD